MLPRAFYKLIHVFGYPKIGIGGIHWFMYLFRYKEHIIAVSDYKGGLRVAHYTPYYAKKRPKPPPQEGAEEVLEEFADKLMKFIMMSTLLNFKDTEPEPLFL